VSISPFRPIPHLTILLSPLHLHPLYCPPFYPARPSTPAEKDDLTPALPEQQLSR
jgi:hypothetical protein